MDTRDFFERSITLGASMTALTSGSGTVSVQTSSTSITFSTSQSGLTGLAFVCSGDVTGCYNTLITGGSGTTLDTVYPVQGTDEFCCHMEHTYKAH